MTTIVFTRAGSAKADAAAATGARPGQRVWRLLTWPARVIQARRDLAQLGAMSDHELSDIGLSRQDLRNATAMGLDADPTLALAKAAQERRPRR